MTHETTRASTGASAAVSVVWTVTAISPSKDNPHQVIDGPFDNHAQAQAAADVHMAYNRSVEEVRICRVEVPA
jgi:hypothetical protein